MPGEGKSTTSMAVALLAAQAKARVILVDGDLRNPSLTDTWPRAPQLASSTCIRKGFLG